MAARWARRLVVFVCCAVFSGLAASVGKLLPVELSDECSCVGLSSAGWSASERLCLVGFQTNCQQCPHQARCASLRTVVGDGIGAFQGDCRAVDPATCPKAATASLSYPSGLAIDEADNLYIADHGNNRIRMLDRATETLTTIAGSGEMGFSGDGGPARRAFLRKPEGLAVKPGALPKSGVGREVYFADFGNQRIRKLVFRGTNWFIYTVAGTGDIGNNPLCDAGCGALTAKLSNPRALAFASNKDLYFVDSGNKKIRKLTTSSYPDETPGNLSTFIGRSYETFGRTATPLGDVGVLGNLFLPGHWDIRNENLVLDMVYQIAIDHNDNLWFTDSFSNRMYMAPLVNKTVASSSSWLVNMYADNYMGRFDKAREAGARQQVLKALLAWLPVEIRYNTSMHSVVQEKSQYLAGYSYWMYARSGQGDWCEASASDGVSYEGGCRSALAQSVMFQSVMSMCFDSGDNVFISDQKASQLLHLTRGSKGRRPQSRDDSGSSMTSRGCRCLKYWHYNRSAPDPCVSGNCRALCRQNPEAPMLMARANLKPGISDVSDLPPCETQDFCAVGLAGDVEWCYIDTDATGQPAYCQETSTGSLAPWGWCGLEGPLVSFALAVESAMLGNELRAERLQTGATQQTVLALAPSLTDDMWVSGGKGTILEGFVYTDGSACATTCCGLGTRTLDTASVNGTSCALNVLADLYTLTNSSLLSGGGTVTLVYSDADTMSLSEEMGIEECTTRCELDDKCKSFMVGFNSTLKQEVADSTCYFFAKNNPFYALRLHREKLDNVDMSTASASTVAAMRVHFGTRSSPFSRLFSAEYGVHVTNDGLNSRDLVPGQGANEQPGLRIDDCMDLCIRNSQCYAILFPACYLLNAAASERIKFAKSLGYGTATGSTSPSDSPPGASTAVFVKQNVEDLVQSVAGITGIFARGGAGRGSATAPSRASRTPLDRPGACVVSSEGEPYFADVWNQQVRKVSGLLVSCLHVYSGSASEDAFDADIAAYTSAVAGVVRECEAEGRTKAVYEAVQEDVRGRSVEKMRSQICQFEDTTSDSTDFYGNFTNNTIVLCSACKDLSPRPSVCPWESMCACRSAMTELLQTKVYRDCRTPNSYHDEWHTFASSYIACWGSSLTDAKWLTDAAKLASLRQALQSY